MYKIINKFPYFVVVSFFFFSITFSSCTEQRIQSSINPHIENRFISDLQSIQNGGIGSNSEYTEYLKKYSDILPGKSAIRLMAVDSEIEDNLSYLENNSLVTHEESRVKWSFFVPDTGMYECFIHYYPLEGKGIPIERKLMLDGKMPFWETQNIILKRFWHLSSLNFIQDIHGNELKPDQKELFQWNTSSIKDWDGNYSVPYHFYLERGDHDLTLIGINEGMKIGWIEFVPALEKQSYAKTLQKSRDNGFVLQSPKDPLLIQAEHLKYSTSQTLYPVADYSSPLNEPSHYSKIRLNTIGGNRWSRPGESITWEIDIPEDGLYHLGARLKQDLVRGMYSTRILYIDGKIPFIEAEEVRFLYDNRWQNYIFGGSEEPWLLALKQGTHEITLETTLGGMAPVLLRVNNIINALNAIYREIIVITGPVPDQFRDYQLEKHIPDLLPRLHSLGRALEKEIVLIESVAGTKVASTLTLSKLIIQIDDFVKRIETIPERISAFKSNISALGSWVLYIREQPLLIDTLFLFGSETTYKKANAGFIRNIWFNSLSFIGSFFEDYSSVGMLKKPDNKSENPIITVWVGTGRDQVGVMRFMIDESFTRKTGIRVDLKLVGQNVLLPAILAGMGPDVALMNGNDIPVNFAMRNAVLDLTQFADFQDVIEQFHPSALVPYKFQEGIYGLPDMQNFPMLYYRQDILNQLELEVPKTWDDVIAAIPTLQKNNLEFYLDIIVASAIGESSSVALNSIVLPPNPVFSSLLFQYDGKFYKNNGKSSALTGRKELDAFKTWADFYTNYKFPLKANFMNRFRTGEIPMGVADYTWYSILSIFAPELKGLWDFAPIPGRQLADGSIKRDVAAWGTSHIILKSTKEAQACWEFLKWFVSTESQIRYAREMESIIGDFYRHPTANLKALESLPWNKSTINNLVQQRLWLRGIPEIPGGYVTGRYIDNAFRQVVDDGVNPREALYDYVEEINKEIAIKRREFKLE